MSYVLCSDQNHYKFDQNLQNLFNELVIKPFRNHPPTQSWESEVRTQETNYHRMNILDRGRTNFNDPYNGLTPEDKVLLYCMYYMPMHLFSSYHIYKNHLTLNNKVVFLDIGCGPLTSGIAFCTFAQNYDMTYLGIDISRAMIRKAKEFNQFRTNEQAERFFSKSEFYEDLNKIPELLRNFIVDNQTYIILNFCYVLASRTLNIENLSNFIDQIIRVYHSNRIIVVYQNPTTPQNIAVEDSFLHKKWFTLKQRLPMFTSQIPQPKIESFSYNNFMTGRHNSSVYFDILYNE